jgi:diguanylate cyclase (GGDEF)-like protein
MAAPATFRRSADSELDPPTRPFDIVDPATRERGMLVETCGVFAGRPHPVGTEPTTIGRAGNCTLQIDDDALSRVHARVTRVGNEYVLEDMGSLNGCFVGDQRVSRASLRDGDRVRLGPRVDLRFHVVSEEEEKATVRLYEAGLRDPLTGLPNRRQLDDALRAELSYARRHGTEVAVVMVDIDRFKVVNDSYGHLVGDAVLRFVGQVLSSTVRVEDLVARFGGEEFVVIARGTHLAGGAQLAERLRSAVEGRVAFVEGVALRVTASFGVASIQCTGDPSPASLLERADQRLYRAKATGRNRVVASD